MMPYQPTKDEIHNLWEQLWSLHCQLDEKMQSKEASIEEIEQVFSLGQMTSLHLKTLLDVRKEPNEELLEKVREEFDFQEAA